MANHSVFPADASPASRPQRAAVRVAVAVAVFAWVAGIAFGLQRVWSYQSTPGAKAEAPAKWPAASRVVPVAGQSTLVMFVHPLCSCTRASLAELDNVVQKSAGRMTAWVLFLHPEGTTGDWENSATWKAAQRLRGVHLISDRDGSEAERFGAATSGQVVLYDAKGQLEFSGGITGERGHVGANSGEARVVSFVATGTADSHDHAVYGCGLHDPNPRTDSVADGTT